MQLPVIPTPRRVTPQRGRLVLDIEQVAGVRAWAVAQGEPPECVRLTTTDSMAPEAYDLRVERDHVSITSRDDVGARHAAQTLRQLLPAEPAPVKLAAMHIEDAPAFWWRGLHVDVSRHWFPLNDLKRLVDTMALHKLNRLHWHLTDDQGWRLEIEAFPRLTDVGAWRTESPRRGRRTEGDGERYGGFYTQDGARELVAYAAKRGIAVMPEIDLPGHMQAAIAAYPELGHGAPPQVWTRWGISDRILNVKDETLDFLDRVLEEVAAIFPDPYVHLGGDEAPTAEWKACPHAQARVAAEGLTDVRALQGWFVRRMTETLRGLGKRPIVWDELLQRGGPTDAAVMVWRDPKYARIAASRGHDVVMCPTSHCYFDYYQGAPEDEPEAIGGDLPLEQVLSFQPADETWSEAERAHLLGVQGNLWTEYIHDAAHLEYMAWPRAAALAEVAWTGAPSAPGAFRQRWVHMSERLHALGVSSRPVS